MVVGHQGPYTSSRFTILGHRGARGHAPENTMPSFAKAVELGATMFELDIHLSKDGKLVVMHDPDVERTTNGTGRIRELTWEEISRLDAGSWYGSEFAGTRVPRLEEVFAAFGNLAEIDIEIKADEELYGGIVERLARLVTAKGLTDRVLISSFHTEYLREARTLLPEAQIGLIYRKPRENVVAEAVKAGWQALHPHLDLVSREFVAEAHAHNLVVRGWNPNEIAPMRTLIESGVDGVGTDYPERLRDLVEQMGIK